MSMARIDLQNVIHADYKVYLIRIYSHRRLLFTFGQTYFHMNDQQQYERHSIDSIQSFKAKKYIMS
jgi:hypothetical protein